MAPFCLYILANLIGWVIMLGIAWLFRDTRRECGYCGVKFGPEEIRGHTMECSCNPLVRENRELRGNLE
jgi:hypothetical protein